MSRILSHQPAILSLDGINPASPQVNLDGTEQPIAYSFYTLPFNLEQADAMRCQVNCSAVGAIVGSFKIQASIDPVPSVGQKPSVLLVNWADTPFVVGGVSQTSFAINGATNLTLDDFRVNYMWIRGSFTWTSGSFTPTIRFQTKGIY